ncbi:MAG TPA: iron ABC transporter permease [Ignavibacteria bacterium]|nr:iron ABC transporter permease [Ignavibacteria bacterium]
MNKKILVLISIFILLIASMILYLSAGSVAISVRDILSSPENEMSGKILFDIRLPRLINVLIVGSALAVSGLLLQALIRNYLAEPGLMGISAGAGLGAILMFLLPVSVPFYLITPVSFLFAIGASMIIYFTAKGLNYKYTNFINSNKIILAGIAISAFLSSLNGFLLILSGKNVTQIIYWLNGGFGGKAWNEVYMSLPVVIAGIVIALTMSKSLNILALGEEMAASMGLRVKMFQIACVGVSALLAASAVSVAGIISFAGLVVPNMARILLGSDYRYTVPASVMLGALLLTISDLIARVIILPAELPTGIITAFIGAPFFIYLILKKNSEIN